MFHAMPGSQVDAYLQGTERATLLVISSPPYGKEAAKMVR
jgi:hypothetical protein